MENIFFGNPPYQIILVHGGPGAAGSMASLAGLLYPEFNSYAPWQTADSVEGQIEELHQQINQYGKLPVILIGHSWGAWLGWLYAARYPQEVKQLILIAPGVFEESYVKNLMPTRLGRLTQQERNLFEHLMKDFNDPDFPEKDSLMAEFGKLMRKADAFDELALPVYPVHIRYEIYRKVWQEASELRKSGELLQMGRLVQCPVIVFHGLYDSTPLEGIHEPLNEVIANLTIFPLEQCGHYPWAEKYARDEFLTLLKKVLLQSA